MFFLAMASGNCPTISGNHPELPGKPKIMAKIHPFLTQVVGNWYI
jgi:hypothetical protein